MTRLNANGMPANAMWMAVPGLVSVSSSCWFPLGAVPRRRSYNKLTLMANVSMTLPYLFLALAFPVL